MNTRAKAVVVSIGVVVAVGAVTAVVTVGVIAGIRHFNQPATTKTTPHGAPESDPAAMVTAPTSEECVRVHQLRMGIARDEGIIESLLAQPGVYPQPTTTSSLVGEPVEPARVVSAADDELMDACHRATEDVCAALNELQAAGLPPTRDAVAACQAACATYHAEACTPPCVWGLFGFEYAPGSCRLFPICDPASSAWLSGGSASVGPPWDRPPPGWVPPTPECIPICDIDRDGFVTARDYAGECAEVAAWLAHDCDTQVAGYSALSRSLKETVSRTLAVCQDADLAGMATLPPTLWQSAWILHWSSAAVDEGLPEHPNINLLIRYRCAGRLTDPCIDYSR